MSARLAAAIGKPGIAWILALTALAVSTNTLAEGSVESGKDKSVTCAACHGADGNSVNPEWPSLAGQNANYLVMQLRAFKSGKRKNVLMSSQTMILSNEDMDDLAAYFASQQPGGRQADPKLVDAGQRLYRGGKKETQISACIACHGPTGAGNPAAGYPMLKGQHATYTVAQLKAYRRSERQTDVNQTMRSIARLLTDDDIEAVSSYIQGLR